eukprot:scaffold165323_cov33-Tisochrysis_lutea.AAC.1
MEYEVILFDRCLQHDPDASTKTCSLQLGDLASEHVGVGATEAVNHLALRVRRRVNWTWVATN